MKKAFDLAWRFIVLWIAFAFLYSMAAQLATPPGAGNLLTPEQAQRSAAMLLIVAALMTGILVYLTLRSRWHGWKLVGAIALIFYVVHTFLSQIETLAFPAVASRMPPGMVTRFFMVEIPMAALFALLAVWILRKWRAEGSAEMANDRLRMPAGEWVWKLIVIAILYVAVYFTFGYFVAWRTPGLPEYYGGKDLGFLPGFAVTMRDTPWLPFFQMLRSLIWAGIAAIIVRMHKGAALETSLAVGLTFSILMAAPLLLPNPIMGDVVARAHLLELVSSNLVFGFLAAQLLMWKRQR